MTGTSRRCSLIALFEPRFRSRTGQWLEQQRIDDTEDGRVERDSDRERRDCRERERGCAGRSRTAKRRSLRIMQTKPAPTGEHGDKKPRARRDRYSSALSHSAPTVAIQWEPQGRKRSNARMVGWRRRSTRLHRAGLFCHKPNSADAAPSSTARANPAVMAIFEPAELAVQCLFVRRTQQVLRCLRRPNTLNAGADRSRRT